MQSRLPFPAIFVALSFEIFHTAVLRQPDLNSRQYIRATGQYQALNTPGSSLPLSTSVDGLTATEKSLVLSALDSSFKTCAASTSFTPSGCPFSDSFTYQNPTNITWNIVTLPSAGSPQFSISGNTITVSGSYDITCTYNDNDPFFGTGTQVDDEGSSYYATVTPGGAAPKVSWQTY